MYYLFKYIINIFSPFLYLF